MRSRIQSESSLAMDEIDRKVLAELQVDARVPFSQIATSVGVSEQTVARRFRRLRDAGVLRVVGLIDTGVLGVDGYIVRIRAKPEGVQRVAEALAERDDISWVTICAGGSEIVAAVRSRTRFQRDDLLFQRLPSSSQVIDISSALVLNWYHPSQHPPHDPGRALHGQLSPDDAQDEAQTQLTDTDRVLADVLAKDGRATWDALARATGWSKSSVARRVESLRSSGVLYFDVDVVDERVGLTAPALLWITVDPKKLDAAGTMLAEHEETSFTAAVSGPTNLFSTVVCRDTRSLYQYITDRVAQIDGVSHIETLPVLRRVKQKAIRAAQVSPPTRPAS